MEHFYRSWVGGEDIHRAFEAAQKKMRRKYKDVYRWGGWVLAE